MSRSGCALMILGLAGCAAPPALTPRVVRGLDDTPLRGADTLRVSVERGGLPIEGANTIVPLPASSFELVGVPLGTDLQLRVEARSGEIPLARGRSFPFDYPDAAHGPLSSPDVLLATLGRFTRTLETRDVIMAIAPTREGAILATSDARVLAYQPHGGVDGAAVIAAREVIAARAGASFVSVPEPDGVSATLLAVGGLDDGATWIDAAGTRATLEPRSGMAWTDTALASAGDGRWVVAIGGRDHVGAPTRTVLRLDLDETGIVAVPLPPLPDARADATATSVVVDVGGMTRELVLVAGGGVPGSFVLIDPEEETTRSLAIEPTLDDRALVAVETGLVVAAGGRDASGTPSDAIDLYVVRPDREPPIARVTPAPEPLFAPRAGAHALRLGPGLALFVSGLDTADLAVRGAELVEVRLDALPATVVPTGTLPIAARVHGMARLADRSVLVVGEGVVAAYVPPRGPE